MAHLRAGLILLLCSGSFGTASAQGASDAADGPPADEAPESPGAAVDEPADGSEGTDVEALLEEGLSLREQGRDQEALQRFHRANDLVPTPRALTQIALAEQALGLWVEAEAHLREALAVDDDWIEPRRGVLEGEMARIGERLGSLEILGGVEGATVRVDGEEVGTLPLTAPIRRVAGNLTVAVSAEGHHASSRSVTVPAGGLARETFRLAPIERDVVAEATADEATADEATADEATADEPVVTLAPVPAETSSSPLRAVGFVALGGAVVMGAVSLATFLVHQDAADEFNGDECIGEGPTQSRGAVCPGAYDRAVATERASTAAIAITGALGVTGALLLLLAPSSTDPNASAAVSCGGGPGSFGVSCVGHF